MFNANEAITTIEFNYDLSAPAWLNPKNPASVKRWVETLDEGTEELLELLSQHEAKTAEISKEEIKEVFEMLKARELHPCGEFDKQGRFYLEDHELVNARTPSVQYPYSQMTAGRTAKFVKAMAEKYKCANKAELIACFKGA